MYMMFLDDVIFQVVTVASINPFSCDLFQALLHASVACQRKLVVDWVPSSDLEDMTTKEVYCLIHSLYFSFILSFNL